MTWADPAAEPDFPPLLSGRRIIPGVTAAEAAIRGAGDGTLGAGDVLWDGDPTRAALAVVLEPDVPLRTAAQVLPLAMVAVADCVGALAPPQVGVLFRWPGTITVNDATVGSVRLIASTDIADAVPDWIVVSIDLRMRLAADAAEPGKTPDTTTLADEGCEDVTHLDVMGSFARHFLTWLNIWQDEGFKPVHQSWMERAEGRNAPVRLVETADPVVVVGMDAKGDLLVRRPGDITTALPLIGAVETRPASLET